VDEGSFEGDLIGGFIFYSPEFKNIYEDLLSEF